jgi:hypothetical protein
VGKNEAVSNGVSWAATELNHPCQYTLQDGHVIAQAVSRRLPIAAARVRARVRSCGICGGQSGTGAGFLQVLRFPLPIRIPSIAPQSLSGAGTIGQTVVRVPSGQPTVQCSSSNCARSSCDYCFFLLRPS